MTNGNKLCPVSLLLGPHLIFINKIDFFFFFQIELLLSAHFYSVRWRSAGSTGRSWQCPVVKKVKLFKFK